MDEMIAQFRLQYGFGLQVKTVMSGHSVRISVYSSKRLLVVTVYSFGLQVKTVISGQGVRISVFRSKWLLVVTVRWERKR